MVSASTTVVSKFWFGEKMAYSLFFVPILSVIGIILRRNIAVFRWLFIPSSVIAGVVGLAIIQAAFHVKGFAKEQSETTAGILR